MQLALILLDNHKIKTNIIYLVVLSSFISYYLDIFMSLIKIAPFP
jgi:hypothetical protein